MYSSYFSSAVNAHLCFNDKYLIQNVNVYIFNHFNYYSEASHLSILNLHFLINEMGKVLQLLFCALFFV